MIAIATKRLAVLALLATLAACGQDDAASAPREFDLGPHRVRLTVPAGWEALDQGKQKRFRKGELEIVLQNLGAPSRPPASLDQLIDWGLAALDHTQRREVSTLRTVMLDGREAVDIETWNRLDHTNPQRIFFIEAAGDLLALHTVRMALRDSLQAFDVLRASIHFVSDRR